MWLHWMPDYLREEGLTVHLWSGWKERTRDPSPDGLDNLLAWQVHHTASPTSQTTLQALHFMWEGSSIAPIGNLGLSREGEWWVGAAGASNTGGMGGPLVGGSRGTIPLNNSNRNVPAIEAINNGTGEPWSPAMCDAYTLGVAALIKGANRETPGAPLDARDVHSHSEWAPTRKLDPAGPSRFRPEGGTWSHTDGMDRFRGEVFQHLLPPPPPTPAPDDDLLLLGGDLKPRLTRSDGQYLYLTGIAVQPKTEDEVRALINRTGPDEILDLARAPLGVGVNAIEDITPLEESQKKWIPAFGRLVPGNPA